MVCCQLDVFCHSLRRARAFVVPSHTIFVSCLNKSSLEVVGKYDLSQTLTCGWHRACMMAGVRRFRFLLFIAAISAISIYYLSARGSWAVSDIESIGHGYLKHDASTPKDPPPDPLAPRPLPLLPETDEPSQEQLDSDIEALDLATSSNAKQHAPTTSTTCAFVSKTITGEELLSKDESIIEEAEIESSGRYEPDASDKSSKKARWRKPAVDYPVPKGDLIHLPASPAQELPKVQAVFEKETPASRQDRLSKLAAVKASFKHAWAGYKKYGLGHDEVKPLSKGFADPFNGWQATLVDSLDTLWIMGYKSEFEEALLHVEKIDFHTSIRKDIPLFETVIRYLGGLLGAYDVTEGKYTILLQKSEELAEILMGAFDTPNRMPMTFYNWAPSSTALKHRAGTHAVMAELGSLSVEMTRLAQITGKHEYYDAVARITNELEKWQPDTLIPGLWPLRLDASGCEKPLEAAEKPVGSGAEEDVDDEEQVPEARLPKRGEAGQQEVLAGEECITQGLSAEANAKSQIYGIGGQADSAYEYFPKMHALLRGRSKQFESMYRQSADAIRKKLLFRPMVKDQRRKILFAASHKMDPKGKTEAKRDVVTYEVTHLSCFVGGMFGLGAKLFGIATDLQLAKQLTDGCVWAYESMPSGVMPESAAVVPCPNLEVCVWNETRWHDALDPNRMDRFAAVDAWNKRQKAIYEGARKEASAESAEINDSTGTIEVEGQDISKRQSEPHDVELDDVHTEPIQFIPKVALSHEKYVAARVQEDRLPASYTKIFARHYGLRPEAIESVFYMYRITGDEIWRQKGWKMFEAIQSVTQTQVANAALKDVTSVLGEQDDSMESFWLAETLKYFYLLFDEPERWSLDNWVLNTEAHLMRIAE